MDRQHKNSEQPTPERVSIHSRQASATSDESVSKRRRTSARETIHPRISREAKSAGTQLAQRRQEKLNTFWSTVLINGLPITAALTPPDEAGMHGPWSSKQLAQSNRLLVEQLLAFQIHQGELPSVLEVLRVLLPAGSLTTASFPQPSPLTVGGNRGGMTNAVEVGVYEGVITNTTIQQDITEQGFGLLFFI